MTDLEMTRLCAEAMDVKLFELFGNGKMYYWNDPNSEYAERFDPLHDDAQAMALVKKFELDIERTDGCWFVYGWELFEASHITDLNRAIVECVAKMQKEKK